MVRASRSMVPPDALSSRAAGSGAAVLACPGGLPSGRVGQCHGAGTGHHRSPDHRWHKVVITARCSGVWGRETVRDSYFLPCDPVLPPSESPSADP